MSQADNVEQSCKFLRHRTEAVSQTILHLIQLAVLADGIKLLVDTDLLRLHLDVGIRNEGREVSLDSAVLDVCLIDIPGGYAGLHTEFVHSFGKYFLVCLVAHVGNETALLRTKQVSRSADIQILHCNVESASEVGELLYCLEPAPGIVRKGGERRHDQVAECLLVRPSYTASELMQVAESEILGLVDDDGIGVRNVYSVLYDGGAQQHVVVTLHEVQHLGLQLLSSHLAVRDADFHIGDKAVENVVNALEFVHLVVKEEYLAAAVKFVIDD